MTNPYAVLDHLRSAHAIVLDNVDAVMPYLERYLDVWANKLVADGGEEANDEVCLFLETSTLCIHLGEIFIAMTWQIASDSCRLRQSGVS